MEKTMNCVQSVGVATDWAEVKVATFPPPPVGHQPPASPNVVSTAQVSPRPLELHPKSSRGSSQSRSLIGREIISDATRGCGSSSGNRPRKNPPPHRRAIDAAPNLADLPVLPVLPRSFPSRRPRSLLSPPSPAPFFTANYTFEFEQLSKPRERNR
jgi:hypothetical protein